MNIILKIWNAKLCTGCVSYEGKEMCFCDPIGMTLILIIGLTIIVGIYMLWIIPILEKNKRRKLK